MRLKFWHNALEAIYDTTEKKPIPDHPVIAQIKYAAGNYFFIYF